MIAVLVVWSIAGTALSYYAFFSTRPESISSMLSPMTLVLSLGLFACRVVAVALLFTPSANTWFKSSKGAR